MCITERETEAQRRARERQKQPFGIHSGVIVLRASLTGLGSPPQLRIPHLLRGGGGTQAPRLPVGAGDT